MLKILLKRFLDRFLKILKIEIKFSSKQVQIGNSTFEEAIQ